MTEIPRLPAHWQNVHGMAGRLEAAHGPAIVTFCVCGLAFFGRDVDQADERHERHVQNWAQQLHSIGKVPGS